MNRSFGRVYGWLLDSIAKKKGLAFLVVDPPNQSPEVAGRSAALAQEAGFDAIVVGGSVGAQGPLLEMTISSIRQNSKLPVILFPGNIATISPQADAIYFMSLLNSTDPYYISGAQIASSMPVKRLGLEVIPTSYVVVEPGRAVGWVGRAQLIPRELPYLAAATALGGQFMGSLAVILESGGGAPSPAPVEMVATVRKMIDVPLIVAGGVRTPEFAFQTIKAGADVVHIGSAIEKTNGDEKAALVLMKELAAAVRRGAAEKNH